MSELDEIRRRFETGQLDPILADLERFLKANRDRIRDFRVQQESRGLVLDEETAVKFFILRAKSINPAKEIRDQLDEIRRETWIRGMDSGRSPDPEAIAAEWARRHSACWREHRVTTIVYVFDRAKGHLLSLLR
jgi:hypothetical protein